MRHASHAILLAAFLASCGSISQGSQGESTTGPQRSAAEHRASLLLARRVLTDAAYDGVESQGTGGLEFSRERPDAVVGWEVGVQASSEEDTVSGVQRIGSSAEVYGGMRKSFGADIVRPYFGVGLSLIRTEIETAGVRDDGGSLAGYAHGGVNFHIGSHFAVGVDLRMLFGSHILYESFDTDGDYGQIGFTMSAAF